VNRSTEPRSAFVRQRDRCCRIIAIECAIDQVNALAIGTDRIETSSCYFRGRIFVG